MADAPSATQNERPIIPENQTSLTQSGTPLVFRMSGSTHNATQEKARIEFYELMRLEIKGKIVQDMEVKKFLDKFLPKPVSMTGVAGLPSAEELGNIRTAKDEDAMYVPFVSAFDLNLETVKLFDCHSKTFHQILGADIKPDVVLCDNKSQTLVNLSMADVGITMEMKFPEDADPFDLTKTNEKQKSTLGQISAYAAAQMAAQFRTHVFSALVFPNFARLLRWDRAGVIVTKKISFATPESAANLADFFQRYDRSSSPERGVDPYVTRISELDIDMLTPEGAEDIKTALKEPDSPTTVYQKITFPDPHPTQTETRSYVVATPYYMGTTSVIGRSTRTFRAYCLKTGKIVFLKDTWRILEKSILPEHETYAKLAAANVNYVATAIDYHDMERQETKTAYMAQAAKSGDASTFRSFRHYRLVLKEFAQPIEEFKDVKELLTVFWNTIQAHHEACHQAKILHRDISSGNIMIYNGKGLLIDWDFSKPVGTTGQRSPERTGTWQFLAYRLAKAREYNELFPEHNEGDDLESFWLVVFWVALRRCEHNAKITTITGEIQVLFDGAVSSLEGIASANVAKLDAISNVTKIGHYKFSSSPLVTILKKYQGVIYQRYIWEPSQLDLVNETWKRVKETHPTSSEADQDKILSKELIDEELPGAAPARWLSDNQWALKLFSDLFADSSLDWETGKERQKRIFPRMFNKTSGKPKRKGPGESQGGSEIKRICLGHDLPHIPEGAD